MQFDQFLRRLFWRLRRRVQPVADNDPIVITESPTSAASPARKRGMGVVLALTVVIVLLTMAYAVLFRGLA